MSRIPGSCSGWEMLTEVVSVTVIAIIQSASAGLRDLRTITMVYWKKKARQGYLIQQLKPWEAMGSSENKTAEQGAGIHSSWHFK